MIHEGLPFRWESKGHYCELGADPLQPIDLGPSASHLTTIWDDRYWYTATCNEDCADGTSDGSTRVLERIDRRSGVHATLGSERYGVNDLLPYEDAIFVGMYGPYRGGLYRIDQETGREEQSRSKTDARSDTP